MINNENIEKALNNLRAYKRVILQWPTGVGKGYFGAKAIQELKPQRCLLLVAETFHKKNWQEEFEKQGVVFDIFQEVVIECYASLKKYEGTQWEIIILDEAHHVGSELRTDILKTIKTDMVLCLSATLDRDIIASIESCFGKFYIDKISISKAIEQNMLPVPEIYTIPLTLDNTNYSETITETWGNKLKRIKYRCKYTDRWAYKKNKSKYPNVELEISCTQKQKYLYICEQFEFWKQRYFQTKNQGVKNLWMQMGNQRKIYLGSLKTNVVKEFLKTINDKRYICFCTNIQQADEMGGENAIHTKAQDNEQKLYEFNMGIRDHIFAVSMLREGQNLNNIEAGIIVQTEGVELSTIQRIGRILRSKKPIIYIFYYEGTRDEEFVRNALKDIDSKYIQQLTL